MSSEYQSVREGAGKGIVVLHELGIYGKRGHSGHLPATSTNHSLESSHVAPATVIDVSGSYLIWHISNSH